MKDYTLLQALDVTDGGKKTTKPAGTIVSLNDALAKWLDDCGVISISGEVKAPRTARAPAAPPRKSGPRCCGSGW